MKIVLINPPSPFLIDQKSFPPLGLLYIASALEKNNYDVEIIDLANRENDLEKYLENCEADIYAITSTTPQYFYAKIIKNILKNYCHNSKINSKIIIGGSHASSIPDQCIKDGFDHVIVGEGENAILKIIHSYEKNKNEKNKKIEPIVNCPYIENLDSIPFPARHLIDIKSYSYDIDDNKATTIITSRGCPFKCAFCSKDVWKQEVRYHSPEYIVNELKEIISKYEFRNFLFLDDSMSLNKKRLYELCDLIEPLDIKWRCYARTQGMNKKILLKMKKAGCIEIGVGIESGSQKILDIIDKRTNTDKNLQFIKCCKEVGIKVNVFVMIGLPGETYQTVEKTKKWMKDALPDKFGFNIFVPYIGTPIYNNPHRYDIKIYDMPDEYSWAKGHQGDYRTFISTKGLSRDEILRLFNENFEYYSNLIKWRPGIGRKIR